MNAQATICADQIATVLAISRYLQKALAMRICRGLRHSGSNRRGLATREELR